MSSLYSIFRFVGRSLLPPRLRNHLDIYSSLRDTVEKPVEIESPENGTILAIAPHPDDEIISCGGTLLRHLDAGARVHICFVMDGRRGNHNNEMTEDEIAAIRKEEANNACRRAGFTGWTFLGLQNRKPEDIRIGRKGIENLLKKLKPDIVYLPSILDQHPEHVFSSRLFIDSSSFLPANLPVRQFETWTPLVPSHVIVIDSVIERKNEALSEYRSQLVKTDLGEIAEAFSRYRGFIHLFRECHAEAFLSSTLAELRRLATLIDIWSK